MLYYLNRLVLLSYIHRCGTVLDADVNGAINILNRLKNEAFTAPHNTKIQNLIDSV